MSNKNKHQSLVFKGQHSPATAYLLSVLENKTKEDTYHVGAGDVERVTAAFAALSEILPHCGVYSPVLKLVKEELYSAVYSDTYTASKKQTDEQNRKENVTQQSRKLDRVPYFVLLKRLQEQRNETAETLQIQVQTIQSRLMNSEDLIQQKKDEIEMLNSQLEDVNKQLENTKTELNNKVEEIVALDSKIVENEEEANNKLQELAEEMNLLLGKKQQLQDENNVLRPYKMNYDTLKDTFDLPPDKRPKRGFRRPILATKKTQLLSSIEAASKLEQQILEIQNKTLEEHDKYLEEVKDKLAGKKFSDNANDPNYYTEELMLENLGDEMTARKQNFQRLVSGMVVELELIRAHREALQSELTQLEQVEMGARAVADGDGSVGGGTIVPSSMAGRPGSSRMMLFDDNKKNGRDSQLSLGESGLEEDNTKLTDPSTDPFNPQERVLSKYSAMIYTSINSGKSFDEINCAKFCISCGEKTAICPHKVTKEDMIIKLPRGCTHVKVSRPQVRIAISVSQQGVPQTASTMYPGRAGADTWLSTRPEPHGWDASGDWVIEEETRQQLAALWDDFKSRTGTERYLLPASRDLSHARVLSLIEQLYASVVWQDDHQAMDDDDDSLGTIKDYMYNFISERYQENEITPMATFDFLAGVIKYATHDKVIQMFGQVTAGNIDGSIARYIHLIADLIDIVQWEEVKDFAEFSQAVYPFLPEEDIDQFVVEYTAFSENKISKSLLMDYFVHIVLKNKEPRIQEAESKLSSIQVTKAGFMQMSEFVNSMEYVAPLTNEQLWRKLMKETFKLHKHGDAPISSLAGIAAYVSLVQVVPLLKDQLVKKIEKARELRRNEVGTKLQASTQLVSETVRLVTMNEMKQLGFNVSRQRQAGTRQLDNEFDDFYWQSRPDTQESMA
uniref:uncharacterized protein LOC120338989 n=1 Tax=Styela clava TaxID=7725 RepID=UPI001939BE7A|nr:uncharacterized protein LOC120338989 [Styela clava]